MPQSGAIKAGSAFIELFADAEGLQRGLGKARASLEKFSRVAGQIGAGFVAIGASITGPILAAAKTFADTGDQLDKLSLRTGIAVEALSEFAFAASQTGASIEEMEKSTRRMQRTINDAGKGTKIAVDAFAELGLTAEDLQNLTTEQQFVKIGNAIGGISNETKRAATAMDIFGRSGTQLLPLFLQGAEGLEEYRKQAHELGLVMSKEDATAAAELTDAWDKLERATTAAWNNIGASVAPTLTKISESVSETTASVGEFIDENRDAIVAAGAFGVALGGIGAAILTVAGAAKIVTFAIAGVQSAIALATASAGVLAVGLPLLGAAAAGVALGFGILELAGIDLLDVLKEEATAASRLSSELKKLQKSEEAARDNVRDTQFAENKAKQLATLKKFNKELDAERQRDAEREAQSGARGLIKDFTESQSPEAQRRADIEKRSAEIVGQILKANKTTVEAMTDVQREALQLALQTQSRTIAVLEASKKATEDLRDIKRESARLDREIADDAAQVQREEYNETLRQIDEINRKRQEAARLLAGTATGGSDITVSRTGGFDVNVDAINAAISGAQSGATSVQNAISGGAKTVEVKDVQIKEKQITKITKGLKEIFNELVKQREAGTSGIEVVA